MSQVNSVLPADGWRPARRAQDSVDEEERSSFYESFTQRRKVFTQRRKDARSRGSEIFFAAFA